jgi:hypothetical protein
MDLRTTALTLNKTAIPQAGEMLRDVRLGESGERGEIGDAALATGQLLDQRETAGI